MCAIAIDGPSGAGKSSLAQNLAERLGFWYLDTGALYRAFGLYVFEAGLGGGETEQIEALVDSGKIKIELAYENRQQKVFLNGADVSEPIRQNHISKYASDVSKIPAVRAFLLDIQKNAAKTGNIIMDGRDIGTVILPGADLKIFLTSTPEERAKRRCEQLQKKGETADYAAILSEINARDDQDSNRGVAPLKPAEDAVLLDNSDCDTPDETLERVLNIVKERLPDVCIR